MRRFEFFEDWTGTLPVGLSGFIFRSVREREGAREAPGTGGTAAGQTLRWGVVSGWSISGARWCNAAPAIICTLAMGSNEATTEPPLDSSFFDLGTWTFHGTGFTGTPFVNSYFSTSNGNSMLLYSGFRVLDGTLPALPLAGLIGLGAGLAAGAAAALRRARSKSSWRASIASLGGSALILSLLPAASDAALERYLLRRTSIESSTGYSDRSPGCVGTVETCTGIALADSGPPAPVLRSLRFVEDVTTTIEIPILSGGVFFSIHQREGSQQPATGQGSTAAGATLRWGVVSGWSISGSIWCRAYPPVICSIAGFQQRDTVDPLLYSAFYDLGTWSFHGTGFTGTPFVKLYRTSDPGNFMQLYSGRRIAGTVAAALPLAGLIGLGAALAAGAAAALRRRGTD